MPRFNLFGELQKAEKQDDGTIVVSGVASSEAVDADGERINATAIKAALPEYMKHGAVREMHKSIAAGVALKAEVKPDGKTYIEARIVDPVTIKKVETGVLTGFSVGGRITSRDLLNKNIITGIKMTEVSLVDRPSNPEALITLCKIDDEDKDKDKEDQDAGETDEGQTDGSDDSEGSDQGAPEGEGGEAEPKSDDQGTGEHEPKADGDDGDDDEDDKTEKLAKLSAAHSNALSKILHLQAELTKTKGELGELRKQAAPPRVSVKSVSKEGDEGDAMLRKMAEELDAMSEKDRSVALIKMIHTRK